MFASDALYSLLFLVDENGRDDISAELWSLSTAGIIEEADGLRAFFDQSISVQSVQRAVSAPFSDLRQEPIFEKATIPQDAEPFSVGNRFYVAPSWDERETPAGRIRLTIDSSISFGSGRHETTQLALQYLERLDLRHKTVFDIGSGSGILTQASRALGAARAFGCDIDEQAVRIAVRQFQLPIFVGSADAVASGVADIVLVNIAAKIIDLLGSELKRIVKPTGILVLTGFLRDRTPRHFEAREEYESDEWLCWVGRYDDLHVQVSERGTVLEHPSVWW